MAPSQRIRPQYARFCLREQRVKGSSRRPPNPVLKFIGVDEQLKVFRAMVDHIQTNLVQIHTHTNMAAMKPVGKKAKGGAVLEIE